MRREREREYRKQCVSFMSFFALRNLILKFSKTLTYDIMLFRTWNTSVILSVDLQRSSRSFCRMTIDYQNMNHKCGCVMVMNYKLKVVRNSMTSHTLN